MSKVISAVSSHITPTRWFVLLAACIFVLLMPIALLRHWRGRQRDGDHVASGFIYGSTELRKGHIRATPIMYIAGLALGLLALLIFVVPTSDSETPSSFVVVGLATFMVIAIVSIIAYWSIVLVNRPKFLVAPYLRDEQGLLRARQQRQLNDGRPDAAGSHEGRETSFDVTPVGSFVHVGDLRTKDVPIWEDAEASVVSSRSMILVGTRSDKDGDVHMSVSFNVEETDSGHEVFFGELALPSHVLSVGNMLARQTRRFDLTPSQTVAVRILVNQQSTPNEIVVLVKNIS